MKQKDKQKKALNPEQFPGLTRAQRRAAWRSITKKAKNGGKKNDE